MAPISLLPRASLLTSAVVGLSIAGGLAVGVMTGGALLLAAAVVRRS